MSRARHHIILIISFTGKLKSFFGDSPSSSVPEEEASTQVADAPSSIKGSKNAAPKETTIPLNVTIKFPSVPPMTVEQKQEARQRYGDASLEVLLVLICSVGSCLWT